MRSKRSRWPARLISKPELGIRLAVHSASINCPPDHNLRDRPSCIKKRRIFACSSSNLYLTCTVYSREILRIETWRVGDASRGEHGTGDGLGQPCGAGVRSAHPHVFTSMQRPRGISGRNTSWENACDYVASDWLTWGCAFCLGNQFEGIAMQR